VAAPVLHGFYNILTTFWVWDTDPGWAGVKMSENTAGRHCATRRPPDTPVVTAPSHDHIVACQFFPVMNSIPFGSNGPNPLPDNIFYKAPAKASYRMATCNSNLHDETITNIFEVLF